MPGVFSIIKRSLKALSVIKDGFLALVAGNDAEYTLSTIRYRLNRNE